MKRLYDTADSGIKGEYLKPQGGRRGLGNDLYAQDAELVQELLRPKSIETTYESYREQNVVEREARLEQALESPPSEREWQWLDASISRTVDSGALAQDSTE